VLPPALATLTPGERESLALAATRQRDLRLLLAALLVGAQRIMSSNTYSSHIRR
jgi:hypothetical protein